MNLENKIICGDNTEVMPGMLDNSIDTIITDPQYGLGFMGKEWDRILPNPITWKHSLRIAKPGAMMLVFGGTRTFHRLTCAIEDAGWEIRDCMMWLYGSGFPKSLDISKAIDKAKGAEREKQLVATKQGNRKLEKGEQSNTFSTDTHAGYTDISEPQTDLAKLWDGYGTALKPAWEPIIVAMKPLDGTFAHNAEKWGVGGLWIDGGRIGKEIRHNPEAGFVRRGRTDEEVFGKADQNKPNNPPHQVQGRWPANLLFDEEGAELLDEQNDLIQKSKGGYKRKHGNSQFLGEMGDSRVDEPNGIIDSGGASRFFYCAKASRSERNAGLEGMEAKQSDESRNPENPGGNNPRNRGAKEVLNNHPTVKPLKLMEYLCKLTRTPTGGIVLDPFGGSGSTALACINTCRDYLLIEKDEHYCEIARARVKARAGQGTLFQ
ncbi:MAG: site-specific DNA-methyltransferase [Sedimentisphaerales bacterium]|nr:site-specific DNA-methyltransferase [Sedimentisphaerales bacterium]